MDREELLDPSRNAGRILVQLPDGTRTYVPRGRKVIVWINPERAEPEEGIAGYKEQLWVVQGPDERYYAIKPITDATRSRKRPPNPIEGVSVETGRADAANNIIAPSALQPIPPLRCSDIARVVIEFTNSEPVSFDVDPRGHSPLFQVKQERTGHTRWEYSLSGEVDEEILHVVHLEWRTFEKRRPA